MFKLINKFKRDEDGAVTVDFVVVTAAVVGLGIAVLATLADGVITTADTVGSEMDTSATGVAGTDYLNDGFAGNQ